MGLLLLIAFAVYAIATAVALAVLWRRVQHLRHELSHLRQSSEARAQAGAVRRARSGSFAPLPDQPASDSENPWARAVRRWRLQDVYGDGRDKSADETMLTPATLRGLTLGVLATAPALGFFFPIGAPFIVASGLAIAAAMMVVALRPVWSIAAWASVFTAAAWASLGFALGAARAEPASYSACIGFVGAAGLIHAYAVRATPGITAALAMCAAALALASETSMIGPAGAAFGVIVALAAIVGAMTLRLEPVHLAAFGAAIIGLFVLSGQPSAALWFTPAATLTGALFLAIAIVRVPQLGSRGLALAGTGAFGALGAILSLIGAQHGLAQPFAAAAALLCLAMILGGVIAAAALRRRRGLAALRFTLWLLALAAFIAMWSAIVIALPAPIATSALALVALSLAILNARIPEGTWRVFSAAIALLAAPLALTSAQMLLAEAPGWPAWLLLATGLCIPAAIFATAALVSGRHGALKLAALFELIAMALAVGALSLAVRVLFSQGALLLQPVGFVEAGVHAAAWLLAALVIGARADGGAIAMRLAAINLLTLSALGLMLSASVLWITDYWAIRSGVGPEALRRETLGFLIPALFFFAHWVFWRARAEPLQTRLVFGAGMMLLAAFVTAEAIRAQGWPDWARALIGAASFALALGLNFAPGVANSDAPPRRHQFRTQLNRDRLSYLRSNARQRAS